MWGIVHQYRGPLKHYPQEEQQYRCSGQTVLFLQTGSTLCRTFKRCWEVHAHHAEVWGPMGHRSQVLRAPETLPSGRAAVSLLWPNSTVSANRKHSVQNFPAMLGGARSSCTGLGAYGASFSSMEWLCMAYSASPN